jgi:serine/threonine protein kinase
VQTVYNINNNGYVHRDIKPLNIIVGDFDSESNWKFDVRDVLDRHRIY